MCSSNGSKKNVFIAKHTKLSYENKFLATATTALISTHFKGFRLRSTKIKNFDDL
jgi:hypothetical protein